MSARTLLLVSSTLALGVFFLAGKDAIRSLSISDEAGGVGEATSQASYSDSDQSKSFFGFASKSETREPTVIPGTAGVDASGLTLMKFGAPWCGPCRMIDREIDSLREKYPDLTVKKVDVDDEQKLAEKFGVSSIPHTFLMKNGKRIGDRVGFQSEKKLERWIEDHAVSQPIKMHLNPFVK